MKKLLTLAACLSLTALLNAQYIFYVTPAGTGSGKDGSSWENARTLEETMRYFAARSTNTHFLKNSQVWMQSGTYYPAKMIDVPAFVKLYGGFAGTETTLPQRNVSAYPTVVDAQQKFGSVFRLGKSATLDGLTIQNGNATGNPNKNGGGVWADHNSVIVNCKIINNHASVNGGGVYAKENLNLVNSIVENNTAEGKGADWYGHCVFQHPVASGCNFSVFDFGTVSFETPTEHTITNVINGQIRTQVWSDAVTATNCQRDTFDTWAGVNPLPSSFYIDCRSNPYFPGDLFSWCAVATYADVLCPAPWRVPMAEDFTNLDMLLGGTGTVSTDSSQLQTYMGTGANQWGGAYGGYTYSKLIVAGVNQTGLYWSQTDRGGSTAWSLRVGPNGTVSPNHSAHKFYGHPLRCVRDTVIASEEPEQVAVPCDSDDFDFGTVSFETPAQTVVAGTVDGQPSIQIWSDAVTSVNCQKTTFNGGTSGAYNVDCRTSPDYAGDFFTWCAVANYGDVLCPAPWRVPTMQDFISLDKVMGGTGENRVDAALLPSYTGTGVNQWSGVYGGFCHSDGPLNSQSQGSRACYWSQSENTADNGRFLAVISGDNVINPQNSATKHLGFALRCVRDSVIVPATCTSGEFDFGTVSFETPAQTVITETVNGQILAQIWSDAVTATNCQKTTYNGGSSDPYYVDCRTNPAFPGDYFSWCAVSRYASTLCPAPWRVPDTADFFKLDQILGGYGDGSGPNTGSEPSGTNQWGSYYYNETIRDKYLHIWNGFYGGACSGNGALVHSDQAGVITAPDLRAQYWSQSINSAVYANCLLVVSDNLVIPRRLLSKPAGATLRCVRDTVIIPATCTSGEFEFGTVSFETPAQRTITGIIDGQFFAQIWSDAVTTTNCQKSTFNGGTSDAYYVDCRTSPDYAGDLFSWCAVSRYAGTLCPAPWRVPTHSDFINLDKVLGGTGHSVQSHTGLLAVYVGIGTNQWGGIYGGYSTSTGDLSDQGSLVNYWSQTEYNADNGYHLYLDSSATIHPQNNLGKNYGFVLRCVRDSAISSGCNFNGFDFGTVSFETPTEYVISGSFEGQSIAQIWSDAVTTTNCQKTTFSGGGYPSSFNVDCRTNPNYPGDYFSWCAVSRYADTLCPAPWRVPTKDDFIDLDKALGGTGEGRSAPAGSISFSKYFNSWGGVYGFYCIDEGLNYSLSGNTQNSDMYYWSQTDPYIGEEACCMWIQGSTIVGEFSYNTKNIGMPLRCVRDTVIEVDIVEEPDVVAVPCDSDEFDFGTVSFYSPTERAIIGKADGQTIAQIWSDAVTATNCQKTAFDGGSTYAYKVDCRSNPDYPGDLFSGCAVMNYADVLCPAPWRVPDTNDFINLDKALGGTGVNSFDATARYEKYTSTATNRWGGAEGGYTYNGELENDPYYSRMYYWSQTEMNNSNNYCLLAEHESILPRGAMVKTSGLSLRCVRDTVVESDIVVAVPCDSDEFDFGTVSFETSAETVITGTIDSQAVTQIWSDAVTATNCQKITFDGGSSNMNRSGIVPVYNVDCRSNPDYPGDLFSGCAVMNYADVLCPAPWRVPTKDDFINLDKALGGSDVYRIDFAADSSMYLGIGANQWNGVSGGFCYLDGPLLGQGTGAYYWSQTVNGIGNLYSMTLNGYSTSMYYFSIPSSEPKYYGIALRCVKDAVVESDTVAAPCDSDEFDLGTVSFETPTETVLSNIVEGQTIGQIWSDAVTATNCQKDVFAGGTSGNYNTTCRSNPDYPGDLFTWCAVANYADVLCPGDWRVPTREDFIDLDKILNGTGENRTTTTTTTELLKYFGTGANQWGGTYGGFSLSEGTLNGQGTNACYWSQVGRNADKGYNLYLHSSGYIYPQKYNSKYYGFALRCVKDIEVEEEPDIMAVPCDSDEFDFGTVSFETPAETVIAGVYGGQVIAQVWSDAVTTTSCQKDVFAGGTSGNYNVTCRSNPDYPGDLFTWCAVSRYAEVLCPGDWRVPTQKDLDSLYFVLNEQTNSSYVYYEFLGTGANQWDGINGGYSDMNGRLYYQGVSAYYWLQTNYNSDYGGMLMLDLSGHRVIHDQSENIYSKNYGFALRCVKDTVIELDLPVPCNSDEFDFGTVSFETPAETIITGTVDGQPLTQIWSDAVTTTNCQKTTYQGGEPMYDIFYVDCRNNPDYPGDLFSGCAAVNYANMLCPAPWRIPTKDDFINLDKAMGGTGANRTSAIADLPKYMGTWANQWNGAYGGSGNMGNAGSYALYWSQTKGSSDTIYSLEVSLFGNIFPQYSYHEKRSGFAIRCVRDSVKAVPCDSNFNFGAVRFETPAEDTVTGTVDGQPLTQIWSDAVTATNCQKTAFNGGVADTFNVDCRSNPDHAGDLFSWCAVAHYADVLCPAPWRVPNMEDFINLDKVLGGTGANRTGASAELPSYFGTGINQWSGIYGGSCSSTGALLQQGSHAFYWSQTEHDTDSGNSLYLNSTGAVSPQSNNMKHEGFALRCVR